MSKGEPSMKNISLYQACQAEQAEFMKMWEKLVNIDSGSLYGEGINEISSILKNEFLALGAEVEQIPMDNQAEGTHTIVRIKGTGKGKILAAAHVDTVFAKGTAKARPFSIDGQWAKGPGVADCKAGVNLLLSAIKLLKQMNYTNFAEIGLFFNCDEEIGSPSSHKILQKIAPEYDCMLCCESGQVGDGLANSRKGSSNIIVEVHGVSSHAGSAPEKGSNAMMELLNQINKIKALEDIAQGTTINFTVCSAGDRVNVIPNYAVAKADMRVCTNEEIDRVEKAIADISGNPVIKGTKVVINIIRCNPPFTANPRTDNLIKLAQEIYGELDKKLIVVSPGGASDANWVADVGVPVADGFSVVKGGKNHTPDESSNIDTIVPRLYLLTRLFMELGHGVRL